MSVYWEDFREYDANPEHLAELENGKLVIVDGLGLETIAGWWVLISEENVKKCVLRILGTLLRAFSAWLALKVSSDNAVGMVAWLTITTFFATCIAVDKDAW
jgi:hypothetical protein